MEVHRHRTTVDAGDPDAVEVTLRSTARGFTWRIANSSAHPVAVRSVTAVCTLTGLAGRLRMYRNGWQSWSETSVATVGVDVDPATVAGALELNVMTHHADPRGGRADRLRSEMVTVLADDRAAVLAGFLGGDLHDGTLWVSHGQTGQELRVQAYLGDAVLAPGEERDLHEVWLGAVDDPLDALDEWATEYGRRSLARTRSPYQVGWCSRYHYFEHVRELDVRENLAAAGDWPVDVFQVDDGYQSCVGDWLTTADSFPSGLPALGQRHRLGGMPAGAVAGPLPGGSGVSASRPSTPNGLPASPTASPSSPCTTPTGAASCTPSTPRAPTSRTTSPTSPAHWSTWDSATSSSTSPTRRAWRASTTTAR